MKKETEIESLARMVANGFSSMDQKFDSLQEHMDERFEGVEGRLDRVERRLDTLEVKVDGISESLDGWITPALEDHARRIKDFELAR